MAKHRQHATTDHKPDAGHAPEAWVQALRFAARRGREIRHGRTAAPQELPALGDALSLSKGDA